MTVKFTIKKKNTQRKKDRKNGGRLMSMRVSLIIGLSLCMEARARIIYSNSVTGSHRAIYVSARMLEASSRRRTYTNE